MSDEVANVVENAVETEVERADSVSTDTLIDTLWEEDGTPKDFSNVTKAELAEKLGMKVGSLSTRLSNLRTIAKGMGGVFPKFKDGRSGKTGKRVDKPAAERALEALFAKNK